MLTIFCPMIGKLNYNLDEIYMQWMQNCENNIPNTGPFYTIDLLSSDPVNDKLYAIGISRDINFNPIYSDQYILIGS